MLTTGSGSVRKGNPMIAISPREVFDLMNELMTLGYLQHRPNCACLESPPETFDCDCGLIQYLFAMRCMDPGSQE